MQPQPTVQRKSKRRRGKGFSRAELREAGADFRQALKSGVPVDPRRKTKYESNVKILEQYCRVWVQKRKRSLNLLARKKPETVVACFASNTRRLR